MSDGLTKFMAQFVS